MNTPKNVGIELESENEPLDLEEAILFTLGEAVFRMRDVFGIKAVLAEVEGQEFQFDVPREFPDDDFELRLNQIIDSGAMLAKVSGVRYDALIPHLLVVDGWSWNENVFRAPIWMHDHREIPIGAAREMRGLKWLTGSSLEIKSKHNTG